MSYRNAKEILPAKLLEEIQRYIKGEIIYIPKQNEEKIKLGDKWIDSNKLFTQDNGKPVFPYSPSHWFNRFIKRNNLPPLTFHQLRHTNASLLIGQGVDVATVSRRLGHADKTITLKIYAHAIKEHDREAADKLGNLLKKKK